jgi:Golgi phosphoprotein 3
VDKGVLRTQKHNFYLFDVATHPLVDGPTKRRLVDRVCDICGGRGTLPTLRETALVSAASAGCVLDPALANIDGFVRREQAFSRAEELLKSFVKSCLAETAAAAKHHGAPLSSAEEVVAGVLQVYCKLDTLLY